MGTSAFDIIGKQKTLGVVDNKVGNSTQNPTTPKSAFDIVNTAPKPLPDPDSFSNRVGNLSSYWASLLKSGYNKSLGSGLTIGEVATQGAPGYVLNAGKAIDKSIYNAIDTGKELNSDIDNAQDYYTKTLWSTIGKDAISYIKDKFQSAPGMGKLISGAASGAIDMIFQTPIEAMTQTQNQSGVAVPLNPDQLAQKYQGVAGTLLMGKVAKEVSSTLLPTEFSSQEAALAAQSISKIGKLGKVLGVDTVAGAASGSVQGAVSGLGSDNDLEKSVIGALTFLPIGAAFSIFHLKSYTKDITDNVGEMITKGTGGASNELAALNSFRVNDNTTMKNLADNIDAINTSDNLLNAAIKAKLKVGQGYVVEGFKPEDELPEIKDAFAYHSPANNSLLVSPNKLNSQTQNFFEKNGFLPREIVNFGGDDNFVVGAEDGNRLKLQNVNTGQISTVPSEALRRTNTSIVTSYIKASDGTPIGKSGVLNPENFIDRIAGGFANFYKTADPKDSFDNIVSKYAQKAGLQNQDLPYFQAAIYKRIGNDLATNLLSPKEQVLRLKVRSELEESNQNYIKDLGTQISQAAFSNGMIIDSDGQGRYNIKFRDGTSYAKVGSPEEALEMINKSGQINANPLDGGGSGAVPTNVAGLGGMSQPFEYEYPTRAQVVDRARLGAIGRGITSAPRWLTLFDNVTKSTSLLTKVVEPIQALINTRKNFAIKTSDITNQLNKVLSMSKGYSTGDLLKVGDNVKTLSADEIKSSLLSRPMLSPEISAAERWFKGVNIKDVTDLMYSTKSIHNFDIGSPEYTQALDLVGKSSSYDPKAIRAAKNLSVAAQQMPLDLFSPYAVLRLAKALEDPSTALTRDQHSAKYLNPAQKNLANEYAKLYDMYDIDPTQKIKGYIPDIPIYNAVGGKGVNINSQFASEMTKVGITPNNNLIQNPAAQAMKYHFSYLNAKSGFLEGMQKIYKDASSNVDILSKHPDLDMAKLAGPLKGNLDTYFNEVLGRPSDDEILSRISSTLTSKMGFRSPDVGSFLNLFSLSNLALRQGLAIRDGWNMIGSAYIMMGHEFAENAFTKAISSDVVKALQDKGVLPRQDAAQIIDPLKPSNLLSENGVIAKLAANAFKVSGQESVYNHGNAGIYMATRELVAKNLRDLQDNKIGKDEAYSNMKLTNHGPTVQTAFNDLVEAGKPDEAADLLGKWNVRTLSTVFGSGNAPIGWKTPWGRLFGQYGTWSTNATNSMIERASYGSKSEVAGRILRSGIVHGATSLAGAALGLNLNSWQTSLPWEVIPGVGPVATVMKDATNTYGKNQDAMDNAMGAIGGIVKDFVPFRRAANNWLDALNKGNIMGGILSAPVKE